MSKENLILSESQVDQIIKRIAYEIYEHNFDAKKVFIVGVYDKGYMLAERLVGELTKIASQINFDLARLDIDKSKPLADEVKLSVDTNELKGRVVVLVDDVLNSGQTVAHSMAALLRAQVKKIQIAVLVNRSHKKFPLEANFKGYELSTTIDEHVEVRLEKKVGVYLY
ncbi:MAG: phosphoribosyltransferase [Cyclobacteriaceae bacterium]